MHQKLKHKSQCLCVCCGCACVCCTAALHFLFIIELPAWFFASRVIFSCMVVLRQTGHFDLIGLIVIELKLIFKGFLQIKSSIDTIKSIVNLVFDIAPSFTTPNELCPGVESIERRSRKGIHADKCKWYRYYSCWIKGCYWRAKTGKNGDSSANEPKILKLEQ